jgi:hypothetical protein
MLHVDQTVNGVAQFSVEPRLGAAVVQNPGCNKNDVRSPPLYFEYPPLVCCIFQVRLRFNMFRQGIHPTDVQFMRQNASGWDIILQRAEHNPRISSFHLFHVYTFMIIHDVRLPRLMVLAILEYHDGAHGMECLFVSLLLLEFYNFWISPNKQHVLSWTLVSQWWYLVCNVKIGIQSWGIHPKNMGTKNGSLISSISNIICMYICIFNDIKNVGSNTKPSHTWGVCHCMATAGQIGEWIAQISHETVPHKQIHLPAGSIPHSPAEQCLRVQYWRIHLSIPGMVGMDYGYV